MRFTMFMLLVFLPLTMGTSGCADVSVTVGSSTVNEATVSSNGADQCSQDAGNKNIRTNSDYDTADDTFDVTLSNGQVTVKRTDATAGWWMDLTITCQQCIPTPAPTPILPIITDVKSCWCREDPHCVGFANSELFHFPKIGDFSFYKNSNIEIRTRQEKPTNRPEVIVVSGVVFKGQWTCDQKIEITRGAWGTYSNSDERNDFKNSYKPVLAVDGSKTEGAGNIITELTSLFGSCNFITFTARDGEQRTLDFKFPDDTTLAIQKWMYFPGFGTTVALNLHKNHYDAAADTGVCMSKDSQASACSENIFTQFSSCVE